MEQGIMNMLTSALTMVNGKKINLKGKEYISGQMETNMMESGRKI